MVFSWQINMRWHISNYIFALGQRSLLFCVRSLYYDVKRFEAAVCADTHADTRALGDDIVTAYLTGKILP